MLKRQLERARMKKLERQDGRCMEKEWKRSVFLEDQAFFQELGWSCFGSLVQSGVCFHLEVWVRILKIGFSFGWCFFIVFF